MSNTRDGLPGSHEDDLARLWQGHTVAAPDQERLARTLMVQTWRFDRKIVRRNFREYAAGIVLLVVYAGQIALGYDRVGGAIGFVSVGFVVAYVWWTHRSLEPLDPAADLAAYRAALLRRFDDQIHLLRTVPYWYLLPLFVPCLWQSVRMWDQLRWRVLVPGGLFLAFFVFVGWLNVGRAVPALRAARAKVEAMFTEE